MINGLRTLGFEPQDNISEYMTRVKRQRERGLELSCPFRYDGSCNSALKFSMNKSIVCENDYTKCEAYKIILREREG